MLVIQPLAFLSNIFVDPVTMPSWQAFVAVNPVPHLVTSVRGLDARNNDHRRSRLASYDLIEHLLTASRAVLRLADALTREFDAITASITALAEED